jgi:hypothetical protein
MRSPFRPFLLLTAALLFGVALSAPEVKAQTILPGQVLISEFRLSGPNGPSDEYIEFYCNQDADCDVSNYNVDSVDPASGSFAVALPAGTIIPARGHLLLGDDTAYSLTSYATLDLIASIEGGGDFFIDNEGFQLRTPDDELIIDSVGFAGGTNEPVFVEGTGLERATSRPADQYAYVRKMGTASGGIPQDTDNNANDFVLVSVTGTPHPGITAPPVLGAPGPENVNSPLTFNNSSLAGTLVEPGASQGAPPNRVRTGTGNSGTLSIRRSITNNTNQTVNTLRFRVVDITTLNSPVVYQQQAQLRLVTSGDAETFTNSQGRTVVIKGTVLQFDDGETQPDQPNGGGLNSSASVDVGVGLAPGETIDVQFLLNIVQTGTFRFYVNVEALTNSGVVVASPVTSSTRTARRVGPRRHVDLNRRYSLNPIFAPPSKSAKKKAAPTHILTSTPAARPTPTTRTTPTARETPAATPQGNAATRSNPDSAAPIRPTNSAVRKHD